MRTILLLLLSTSVFAQTRWEPIRLDYNISFSMPVDHRQVDTLGQKNFFATGDRGIMQVAKIPHLEADIHNDEDLINHYNLFQELMVGQAGTFVSDSTFNIHELLVRSFVLETYRMDSLEIHENLAVFIDRKMYCFVYAYNKRMLTAVHDERNRFFSGIEVDASARHGDQFTTNSAEREGEFVGLILRYVILASIVLALVLFILKKYKYVRMMKNFFSMAFLVCGAVSLFLYLGNLFFQNNAYSLLLIAVFGLTVGFVLRIIKIPDA